MVIVVLELLGIFWLVIDNLKTRQLHFFGELLQATHGLVEVVELTQEMTDGVWCEQACRLFVVILLTEHLAQKLKLG